MPALWKPLGVVGVLSGVLLGGVAISAATMAPRNLIDGTRWHMSQNQKSDVNAEMQRFAMTSGEVPKSSWLDFKPAIAYRVSVASTNHRPADVVLENRPTTEPAGGEKLTLSFWARSNSDAPNIVTYRGWKTRFVCSTDWKQFTMPIQTKHIPKAPLKFLVGAQPGAIDIADIRLARR